MDKENLFELVSKNVKCGYQMPLTIEAANKTEYGLIAPYGITYQTAFSDLCENFPNNRLTHANFFALVQESPSIR